MASPAGTDGTAGMDSTVGMDGTGTGTGGDETTSPS
eukprot:CAMPEP_0119527028 /NCGR_PEP_ID=MMETSP1344-20130328/41542_1 /TAXON_ID=236787 /ORGANISM="Florenciella parvula, Strain CCMP2471" /LENGTH=35 /DNA_ID= /DNA_START= /DNA_END= /DNA_ORIENTATION=